MEEPPLQPVALEKYKETRASLTDPNDGGRNEFDPSAYGFPPGAARSMMMPFPFEIVQPPNQVYILFEFDSGIRRIYTDGRKPRRIGPHLDGTFDRHVGGRYAGRGHGLASGRSLAGSRRDPSQRRSAHRRAVPAIEPRHAGSRVSVRGPQSLYEALGREESLHVADDENGRIRSLRGTLGNGRDSREDSGRPVETVFDRVVP